MLVRLGFAATSPATHGGWHPASEKLPHEGSSRPPPFHELSKEERIVVRKVPLPGGQGRATTVNWAGPQDGQVFRATVALAQGWLGWASVTLHPLLVMTFNLSLSLPYLNKESNNPPGLRREPYETIQCIKCFRPHLGLGASGCRRAGGRKKETLRWWRVKSHFPWPTLPCLPSHPQRLRRGDHGRARQESPLLKESPLYHRPALPQPQVRTFHAFPWFPLQATLSSETRHRCDLAYPCSVCSSL